MYYVYLASTPLGFCFLCIVIVTVFLNHHASIYNLKIQKMIKYQIKCHSHYPWSWILRFLWISGQPVLSGHLTIPCGWPLNTGLACSRRSDSRSREKNFTYRCALPERLEQAIQVWLYVQVILTKATNLGFVTWSREAIIAFRQPRKKINGKKNITKYQGKGCFCYCTMGFSVISRMQFTFPK